MVLTFPAAVGPDATTAPRVAGFRFNRVLQHREGLARAQDASMLAKAYRGTSRRVGASTPGPFPQLTLTLSGATITVPARDG